MRVNDNTINWSDQENLRESQRIGAFLILIKTAGAFHYELSVCKEHLCVKLAEYSNILINILIR